jgi:vancomycin resistance protein VanJ
MRQLWQHLSFTAATAGSMLAGISLFMHLTVRDGYHRPAFLYYATPWPLLAIGAGLLAVYWQWDRRRFLCGALALISVVALAGWLINDWEWRSAPDAPGELRVVLWNVDRPEVRFAGDVDWLRAQDADLIAIAERQPKKKDRFARWKEAFPGYAAMASKGEMLCLVRGEVLTVEESSLGYGSYCTNLNTRLRGREVRVLQVDLNGYPTESRRQPLERITDLAVKHRTENLLVLGDFNTPRNSVCFAPLRVEATNAFTAVGRGCAATWPTILPVLSLDQIWTNRQLPAVRCRHVSSWRSDHRAVVAEFAFAR